MGICSSKEAAVVEIDEKSTSSINQDSISSHCDADHDLLDFIQRKLDIQHELKKEEAPKSPRSQLGNNNNNNNKDTGSRSGSNRELVFKSAPFEKQLRQEQQIKQEQLAREERIARVKQKLQKRMHETIVSETNHGSSLSPSLPAVTAEKSLSSSYTSSAISLPSIAVKPDKSSPKRGFSSPLSSASSSSSVGTTSPKPSSPSTSNNTEVATLQLEAMATLSAPPPSSSSAGPINPYQSKMHIIQHDHEMHIRMVNDSRIEDRSGTAPEASSVETPDTEASTSHSSTELATTTTTIAASDQHNRRQSIEQTGRTNDSTEQKRYFSESSLHANQSPNLPAVPESISTDRSVAVVEAESGEIIDFDEDSSSSGSSYSESDDGSLSSADDLDGDHEENLPVRRLPLQTASSDWKESVTRTPEHVISQMLQQAEQVQEQAQNSTLNTDCASTVQNINSQVSTTSQQEEKLSSHSVADEMVQANPSEKTETVSGVKSNPPRTSKIPPPSTYTTRHSKAAKVDNNPGGGVGGNNRNGRNSWDGRGKTMPSASSSSSLSSLIPPSSSRSFSSDVSRDSHVSSQQTPRRATTTHSRGINDGRPSQKFARGTRYSSTYSKASRHQNLSPHRARSKFQRQVDTDTSSGEDEALANATRTSRSIQQLPRQGQSPEDILAQLLIQADRMADTGAVQPDDGGNTSNSDQEYIYKQFEEQMKRTQRHEGGFHIVSNSAGDNFQVVGGGESSGGEMMETSSGEYGDYADLSEVHSSTELDDSSYPTGGETNSSGGETTSKGNSFSGGSRSSRLARSTTTSESRDYDAQMFESQSLEGGYHDLSEVETTSRSDDWNEEVFSPQQKPNENGLLLFPPNQPRNWAPKNNLVLGLAAPALGTNDGNESEDDTEYFFAPVSSNRDGQSPAMPKTRQSRSQVRSASRASRDSKPPSSKIAMRFSRLAAHHAARNEHDLTSDDSTRGSRSINAVSPPPPQHSNQFSSFRSPPGQNFGGEMDRRGRGGYSSTSVSDGSSQSNGTSSTPPSVYSGDASTSMSSETTDRTLSKLADKYGGPVIFEQIQDSKLKKRCRKLFKLLNHDPWDRFNRYDNNFVLDFIQDDPQTCEVQYQFDCFTGLIYPLNMLCSLGASLKVVKLAFEAHEEAMQQTDLWVGTPLHYACSFKAPVDVIDFLVQQRPDALEVTNSFGRTPLHMACLFKANGRTVKKLVQKNPTSAGMTDKDGYVPLHLACENGSSFEVIRHLLKAHPDGVEALTKQESTPLHFAAQHNSAPEIIELLLDENPEGAQDMDASGQTPLHTAIIGKASAEIIEMLLDADPDGVDIENNNGETPYDLAKRVNASSEILGMLDD